VRGNFFPGSAGILPAPACPAEAQGAEGEDSKRVLVRSGNLKPSLKRPPLKLTVRFAEWGEPESSRVDVIDRAEWRVVKDCLRCGFDANKHATRTRSVAGLVTTRVARP